MSAPSDAEQRTIIDKLAQFVARNGPEFEQMTKTKQRDNPKFAFLFGGEHVHYYNYRVAAEQALLRAKNQGYSEPPPSSYQQPPPTSRPPPPFWPQQRGQPQEQEQHQPPHMQHPPPMQPQAPSSGHQPQQQLAQNSPYSQPPPQHRFQSSDQQQSEQSTASHNPSDGRPWSSAPQPLMGVDPFGSSVQTQLESLRGQQQQLRDQIDQSEQNLAAQESVKASEDIRKRDNVIRRGQREYLERLAAALRINLDEVDMVMNPIVLSCTKDSISTGKGWIFSTSVSHDHNRLISTYLCQRVTDPQSSFTTRLHLIYLMNDVLHHCIRKSADELKNSLESVAPEMFCAAHLHADDEQKKKLDKLIALWESKALFSVSTLSKMRNVEATWASFNRRLQEDYADQIEQEIAESRQMLEKYRQQHMAFVTHANTSIKQLEQQRIQLEQKCNQQSFDTPEPTSEKKPRASRWDTRAESSWNQATNEHCKEPVTSEHPGFPENIPDLSKPPPNFTYPTITPNEMPCLIPTMPYYDLPAGLMMSAINLEDSGYKPIDPDKLRLPAPVPPSETLLQAVELFYAQPSHERPRDAEGWEKTGLYEWSRDKAAAVKAKADEIERGEREKSPSPSPEPQIELPIDDDIKQPSKIPKIETKPKKRYREEPSSPSNSSRMSRHIPSSSSDSKRQRSPIDDRRHRRDSNSDSSRGSRMSRRSPTPPGSNVNRHGDRLDSSNKGHQMLERMGWRGSGLGSSESGIVEPIKGGEVRDRNNMYKGVGVDVAPDAFEMYRRQRSGSFISRMRERASDSAK